MYKMCPASDPHVFTGSHTHMCIPPRVLSLTGCHIIVRMGKIENHEIIIFLYRTSRTNNKQFTDIYSQI